jgi:uncharacterized cupredoxin-like copper-binding protein
MVMNHHETKHAAFARLFLLAALVAALSLFVACGSSENGTAADAQTVAVHLTDHGIEMPASLPSGMTTFEVTNAGSHEHSFGITGPGGDQTLEKALQPGETASLDMALDSGTYRIYSPVDQSHGTPMQIALNVRPETSGGRG